MLLTIFNCLVALVLSVKVTTKNDNCNYCQFLVETFEEGLRKTAHQHFAGGDTAWEEKNLGKYATSETRLIEVMEGVCKERTLVKPTKHKGLTGLEFKYVVPMVILENSVVCAQELNKELLHAMDVANVIVINIFLDVKITAKVIGEC
uniref:DUF3456 domain-containing protein n=1 Tax=Heterorhabditis bacteriophora TaxID=37862 RepID=A0A1I7WFI2_HETBA